MAVDKKTRFELEEQKKIADEVREAFDENSTKLRKSYSADAQKLLKEMDKSQRSARDLRHFLRMKRMFLLNSSGGS